MDTYLELVAGKNPIPILCAAITILFDQKKEETAKELLKASINIADTNIHPYRIELRLRLSKIMEDLEQFDQAQYYLYEAGRLAESYGQPYWKEKVRERYEELSYILIPLNKFKNYYQPEIHKCQPLLKEGKIEKALEIWRSILNIAKESEQPPLLIEIVLEFSRLLQSAGFLNEAKLIGSQAEDMAKKALHPFWYQRVKRYLNNLETFTKTDKMDQAPTHPHSPEQVLEILLSAEDLEKGLSEYLSYLDNDLVNYINQKAKIAAAEGEQEFATVLTDLALIIEQWINQKSQPIA